MSEAEKPDLTVVAGNFGAPASEPMRPAVSSFEAEAPKALDKLSTDERRSWKYVIDALTRYGLVHKTDAMLLLVIVRTFVQWKNAERTLADLAKTAGHYMVKTPNGYEQPHQMYYVARDLKKQLLQWLPEAALTIPSFAKLTQDNDLPVTGDMFEDPMLAFQNRKKQLNVAGGSQS